MQRNPKWWNEQTESAWERVKAVFKRDWDQTMQNAGCQQPDTHQQVGDTVKQALGKEAIPSGMPRYEEIEDAYRFGFGARYQYDGQYPFWDMGLEAQLEQDWYETYGDRHWGRYRDFIRHAWEYDGGSSQRKAA
jgi:hypothetical protein